MYSPDVYSPDVYSPDANAYASAQLRSVLAVAGFEGTASEGITINTWDNSGDFYIRVRGRNGAFSPAQAFHLEVTLQSDVCDGVTSDLPAPSLAAAAGNFHTLILTDRTRLAVTDPLTPTLGSKLLTLAGRPEVNAEIIDVSADARVAAANAQADAYPACPTAKNLVADAIKTVVDRYRLVNPLEYIVLIGSDDVIPFFRHPDQALLASERNYVPPVRDSSASQASLRLGYVLSQDDYGAAIELDQKITTFPVPDLAVGRLVETPAEIIGMVDAYLTTAAGVVNTPTSALVTGYDFLTDNAEAVAAAVQARNGAAAGALITGLAAKEVVVSTLAQIYAPQTPASAPAAASVKSELLGVVVGLRDATVQAGCALLSLAPGLGGVAAPPPAADTALSRALRQHFTPLSGLAYLAFVLLYVPCVATLGAIKAEFGWRWAVFSACYQTGIAYLVAVLVFQIGRLAGFA